MDRRSCRPQSLHTSTGPNRFHIGTIRGVTGRSLLEARIARIACRFQRSKRTLTQNIRTRADCHVRLTHDHDCELERCPGPAFSAHCTLERIRVMRVLMSVSDRVGVERPALSEARRMSSGATTPAITAPRSTRRSRRSRKTTSHGCASPGDGRPLIPALLELNPKLRPAQQLPLDADHGRRRLVCVERNRPGRGVRPGDGPDDLGTAGAGERAPGWEPPTAALRTGARGRTAGS